jgi:ABC-type dipeptide/oligopeptide/nickel transport system ATPase component
MSDAPVLSVKNLRTYFYLKGRVVKAVDDVSMDARAGRITALVGCSGGGKSVVALSIFNLIDPPGRIVGGEVLLNGVNLLSLGERELQKIRGGRLSMIFQEPASSMNPVMKVKDHFFEAARACGVKRGGAELLGEFRAALLRVGLKNAGGVLESYPFELSGGMCQRVMVAMGFFASADVLIADEPTSSLDLTTQASILRELGRRRDEGAAILLITHDLGVVAQMSDDVYVIRDGRIVESGDVFELFANPRHEYTKSLLSAAE